MTDTRTRTRTTATLATAAAAALALLLAGCSGTSSDDEAQASHASQSEAGPEMHASGTESGHGMNGHAHKMDGGPPPAGIEEAAAPTYPVGTEVTLTADHMPGMNGARATISGAFDTTAYSVTYTPTDGGERVVDHKWVVQEELQDPGPAPLAAGTEVVLNADHMPGMKGATATIEGSTDETVYMVDLTMNGKPVTHHKWVVDSEIHPAE